MKLKELYIIALFIPELFRSLQGPLSLLYWLLEFVRIGISCFYIIQYLKTQKKSFVFKAIVLFHIIIFISSLINNSNLSVYRTIINVTFPNIGIVCFIEMLLCREKLQGLRSVERGLKILVIANLLFMLIFPDGYYVSTMYNLENETSRDVSTYLLSVKNRLILWFVPLMAILAIKGNRKEILFYNLIMFLEILICNSKTSLFVFIIFHILCYANNAKMLKWLTLNKIYLVFVTIFLAIIVYQVQNFFSSFIENSLQKNVELQGRIYIWQIAMELIKNKWLLGYGNAGNGAIIEWNGYIWYSHNLILDILIQSGTLGLITIITLFLKLASKTNNLPKNKLNSNILSIAIFAMLIEGIFESYLNYPQFFFILTLGYWLMHNNNTIIAKVYERS